MKMLAFFDRRSDLEQFENRGFLQMSQNFISDLTTALNRVISPDTKLLKEILIVGGMPEKTEKLRYLSFNRQIAREEERTLEFSAVATLNNRLADQWRLEGYHKKVSQIVFSSRWTRNPLDLFLNSIRCDSEIMETISTSSARYSLIGILQIEEILKSGVVKRLVRRMRPVIAIPDLEPEKLQKIVEFERRNEIVKSRIKGVGYYRKSSK